ncbi:MAG: fumarylacetoacetate hydrolase family protein [Rhodothermaceae bacterium]
MEMRFLKLQNSNEKISIGNIFCIGKNYLAHIEEMDSKIPEEPVMFTKPASTLRFSGEDIKYPCHTENLHYEGELVLVIGKTLCSGTLEEAEDAIFGYGVGLDMTKRDVQKKLKEKGLPWTFAKSFDDSAVLSEIILKSDYKLTGEENLSLYLNEEMKQNSSVSRMIFKPAEVVKYISERITLHKGDLIFTGTPSGVGSVSKGDKLTVKVDNLPVLETKII